jgi:hypothetical protein
MSHVAQLGGLPGCLLEQPVYRTRFSGHKVAVKRLTS